MIEKLEEPQERSLSNNGAIDFLIRENNAKRDKINQLMDDRNELKELLRGVFGEMVGDGIGKIKQEQIKAIEALWQKEK